MCERLEKMRENATEMAKTIDVYQKTEDAKVEEMAISYPLDYVGAIEMDFSRKNAQRFIR